MHPDFPEEAHQQAAEWEEEERGDGHEDAVRAAGGFFGFEAAEEGCGVIAAWRGGRERGVALGGWVVVWEGAVAFLAEVWWGEGCSAVWRGDFCGG